MVEICFRTGDVHGAARYCRKLLEQSDRLNFPDGSSDFKNLLYEYASLQYEYDITRHSLELSENRRTTALLAFFISVAALGAAIALLLYARQRREKQAAYRPVRGVPQAAADREQRQRPHGGRPPVGYPPMRST